MSRDTVWDGLIVGLILVIGAAEAAHLAAVVLGWSLSRCCVLFWGLAGALLAGWAAFSVWLYRKKKRQSASRSEGGHRHPGIGETAAWIMFGVLALSQIAYLWTKDSGIRQGDIMVETVGSFLGADGVYQVNPMTGQAYAEGLPARLKILCLPFLYSSICKATGFSALAVVRTLAPVLTLAGCYMAFAALGNSLFVRKAAPWESSSPQELAGEKFSFNRKGYACFMAIAALLVWTGAGAAGLEGCRLLWRGWQGETIRNCVLLPWMLSLCIRRKWLYVPLCILAEACIVWTLYGMGVCFAAALGMALVQVIMGLKTVEKEKVR